MFTRLYLAYLALAVIALCFWFIFGANYAGTTVDDVQWLLPWTWPFFRAPDSLWTFLRVVGLWFGAPVVYLGAYALVIVVFSFSISTDMTGAVGVRTHARKKDGVFGHYDESSIPSRNLVEIQPQPVPVAPIV